MNIRKQPQMLLMLVLAAFLFACAPAAPATEASEPTTAPTDSAQGFHPLTAETGMEELDAILAAVASGDPEMLLSLVQFTTAECTTQDGLGGPPKCREGEAERTQVEVLPFLGGEGSYLHSENIDNWPGVNVSGLYAVYEVSPAVTYEQYFPAGKYAIVFVGQENQPATVLRVDAGRIVRVDTILDRSPEALASLVQREASNVIFAPPTP